MILLWERVYVDCHDFLFERTPVFIELSSIYSFNDYFQFTTTNKPDWKLFSHHRHRWFKVVLGAQTVDFPLERRRRKVNKGKLITSLSSNMEINSVFLSDAHVIYSNRSWWSISIFIKMKTIEERFIRDFQATCKIDEIGNDMIRN